MDEPTKPGGLLPPKHPAICFGRIAAVTIGTVLILACLIAAWSHATMFAVICAVGVGMNLADLPEDIKIFREYRRSSKS